jgi:flagellar motor switch protein FliG
MSTSLAPVSQQRSNSGPDLSSTLNGPQKAAVLCMALGADEAVKLTQMLTPTEAEEISFHIAQMEQVSAATVETVFNEWLDMALAVDSIALGGFAYAGEILEKAFGPVKAKATLNRIQSQLADTAGLHRLRNADAQQLANTLRSEHPQTIALVLAHLDPQQTASILKELDPMLGGQVMYRIGCMEKVSSDMLQLITRALSNETDINFTRGLRTAGGPEAVASVLNHVSGTLEKDLLDRISEQDAQLCEQIKNLMFVFEDIGSLDDRSLQRLLREIDAKTLSLALKNASEDLKTRIMGGMSQRAVSALKDEIAMLGAVRLRDVEAAQTQIVAQVRALEAAGEVTLGSGGAEDAFIE